MLIAGRSGKLDTPLCKPPDDTTWRRGFGHHIAPTQLAPFPALLCQRRFSIGGRTMLISVEVWHSKRHVCRTWHRFQNEPIPRHALRTPSTHNVQGKTQRVISTNENTSILAGGPPTLQHKMLNIEHYLLRYHTRYEPLALQVCICNQRVMFTHHNH